MRATSQTTANAFTGIFEHSTYSERNPGYAAEQDQKILMSNLEFAERLFPESGLGLCPVSHVQTTYMSRNCENILGHPHNELIKMGLPEFFALIHPEDLSSVKQCFDYIKDIMPFDPEAYRFAIQYRFRTKAEEYVVIRNENLALKVTDRTYLYLMLYNRSVEPDKFHHVKLELFRKKNGSFVKTGSYHPKQEQKQMTPRQTDIALLVTKGYSNQEIADQLGVSLFTIKNHKKMLFRKINVKNSVELANYMQQSAR